MKYLLANWKMYLREKEAVALAKLARGSKWPKSASFVAFPSAFHVTSVRKALGRLGVGVQDVGPAEYGAWTGENSAAEAVRLKARYALVGHSERRAAGEDNALVGKKFAAALKAGLIPVLCVGETEEERKSEKMIDAVLEQIESALRAAGQELAGTSFMVAYEPVWAIGTGNAAQPEDAAEMHLVIRKQLAMLLGEFGREVPIVYGGSVDAENAGQYLALPSVDGLLVGGASTKAESLKALIRVICS